MSTSLALACWWTLARTIVLCLLAWPLITGIERWLRSLSDLRRPFAFALLLAPFLFPELLVGYAYRNAAMSSPFLAEWLCAGLLFFRVVPVGVVALMASPEALVSGSAIYVRWMSLRANPWSLREWWHLAKCYWHGPVRRAVPALCLMSLVAFQEFELAALLQTASWTDWFIAAQSGGLDRGEMLTQAIGPIVIQLPLLALTVYWFSRMNRDQLGSHEVVAPTIPRSSVYLVTFYLVLALTCGCLIPLCVMAWKLPSGLMLLVRQPMQLSGLGREMLIALSISLFSGVMTWFAASAWRLREGEAALPHKRGQTPTDIIRVFNAYLRRGSDPFCEAKPGEAQAEPLSRCVYLLRGSAGASPSRQMVPRGQGVLWILLGQGMLVPGLIGSLLLSLGTVVLFQQLWLRPMYDTPLPWMLTLMVWLLPRAVLLRLWVDAMTRTEGVHLAQMLVNREWPSNDEFNSTNQISSSSRRPVDLLFRIRDQPQLLAIGLLCYWAYLDLSTAYLLAPSGMKSGLVRLYNFMHFGRTAALSAESFLFFGTPILMIFGGLQYLRFIRYLRCALVARCARVSRPRTRTDRRSPG